MPRIKKIQNSDYLHCSIKTSQHRGGRALDIVIEHEVLSLVPDTKYIVTTTKTTTTSLKVPGQQLDGVFGLEVLELYEGPGPAQLDGRHELVYEGVVLLTLQPVLAVTQVPGE